MKHPFRPRCLLLNYLTSTSESTQVIQAHLQQHHQAEEEAHTPDARCESNFETQLHCLHGVSGSTADSLRRSVFNCYSKWKLLSSAHLHLFKHSETLDSFVLYCMSLHMHFLFATDSTSDRCY